jgi:putative tryptophan/tyrosine transport system substrate-binding protein
MKRFLSKSFVLTIFAVVISFVAYYVSSLISVKETVTDVPIVAITQIVPHPSLDQIRQGIIDELKDQKINCKIEFETAQGNIAIATQIAQKFASLKPAVIVPITTPSAQTVYAAAKSQNIPVIFAAVSDPVSAKLVPSMDKAGDGISGISDLSPIADQVALIKEIFPTFKRVGVVSNAGESNSIALLNLFESAAKKEGMTLVKASASNSTDVAGAVLSLVGKIDALYIPNDNMVVSALESVLKIAKEHKIPVFSADPESVLRGCLASVAHSQYGLGRQTGKMVAKVLQGVSIQTLPVERPTEVALSVNTKTAQDLGIIIPKSVLDRVRN